MDEEFKKTAEALKNEEQQRQAEDNSIRAKLEATGTGGVHISAIGVSWLFVGVVLSTAGVEIAELLKCSTKPSTGRGVTSGPAKPGLYRGRAG